MGKRGGERIWIEAAVMSWVVFGVYWLQLDWRASRERDAYKNQSVRLLLGALNDLKVEAPRMQRSRLGGVQNPQVKPVSTTGYQRKKILQQSLNLNTIDSAALEGLPRIGPNIAGRICRFREALGGFHEVDQLGEVWGMHPEQLEGIKPWFHIGSGVFRFLCLNHATWRELQTHPYVRYHGANSISAFRKEHAFDRVEDLRGAIPVTDSLFRRWSPYLRVCKFNENAIESTSAE